MKQFSKQSRRQSLKKYFSIYSSNESKKKVAVIAINGVESRLAVRFTLLNFDNILKYLNPKVYSQHWNLKQ